jgi:hypothetical protein
MKMHGVVEVQIQLNTNYVTAIIIVEWRIMSTLEKFQNFKLTLLPLL